MLDIMKTIFVVVFSLDTAKNMMNIKKGHELRYFYEMFKTLIFLYLLVNGIFK